MAKLSPRLRNIVNPTQLSDADATRMGLKTYKTGVSYTNGTPSVTCSAVSGGAATVSHTELIPYQTQDGNWRMRGMINVQFGTVQNAANVINISGLTWRNTDNSGATADRYVLTAGVYNTGGGPVGTIQQMYATPTLSDITIQRGPEATQYNRGQVNFDLPLTAKPTWAS